MRGKKYIQLNLLPSASLVWKIEKKTLLETLHHISLQFDLLKIIKSYTMNQINENPLESNNTT